MGFAENSPVATRIEALGVRATLGITSFAKHNSTRADKFSHIVKCSCKDLQPELPARGRWRDVSLFVQLSIAEIEKGHIPWLILSDLQSSSHHPDGMGRNPKLRVRRDKTKQGLLKESLCARPAVQLPFVYAEDRIVERGRMERQIKDEVEGGSLTPTEILEVKVL
jgi:hypothetical protein